MRRFPSPHTFICRPSRLGLSLTHPPLSFCPRVTELGEWVTIPTTYAGGAKGLSSPAHRL